jgi:hypothetical protein
MAVTAASGGRFRSFDGVSERGKERERRGGVGEWRGSTQASLARGDEGGTESCIRMWPWAVRRKEKDLTVGPRRQTGRGEKSNGSGKVRWAALFGSDWAASVHFSFFSFFFFFSVFLIILYLLHFNTTNQNSEETFFRIKPMFLKTL